MTTTGTARMLLASGLLAAAAAAAAGEELRFFEDGALSFERERAKEPPAPQPSAPAAEPAPEPAPDSAPAPATPAPAKPRPAPPRATKPAYRSRGGIAASPGPAPARPYAAGPTMDFELLKVRELNADERKGTKGTLRCADPMTAEIRPGPKARALMARLLKVAEKDVPETVGWIFGREERCFDRSGDPLAWQYDRLDEAARRMAPAPEGP